MTPSLVAFMTKCKCLVGKLTKVQVVPKFFNTLFGTRYLTGCQCNYAEIPKEMKLVSYHRVNVPSKKSRVPAGGWKYLSMQFSTYIFRKVKETAEIDWSRPVSRARLMTYGYCKCQHLNSATVPTSHKAILGETQGSHETNLRWKCKYSSLFDPAIYKTAYRRLISKSGNIYAGVNNFTRGLSESDIHLIIEQMKNRSFQFDPAQRESIPEGQGKMRFVGIPSSVDMVVQEAIKLLLQPVFQSKYVDDSFGFESGRSAKSVLRSIRSWTGTSWLIEGHMSGYFDHIDYHVLASLLMREINDQQIVDLYWKLVRAGYVNNGFKEPHNLTGVMQGGILSPLLSNIYLHEFDIWVTNLAASVLMPGEVGKPTGEDSWLLHQITRIKGKGHKVQGTSGLDMKEQTLQLEKQERTLPSVGSKVYYARYADEWLIGVAGSKRLTFEIKEKAKEFITEELKLAIRHEQLRITHLGTERGKFLGTLIRARKKKDNLLPQNEEGYKVQWVYDKICLEAPINELVSKLVDRGFASDMNWPRGMSKWIHLKPEEIIRRYKAVNRGLMKYYSFVDNKNMMHRIEWILRFSAVFTLCRKWRLSTRALFQKLARSRRFGDFVMRRFKPTKR